MKTITRTMQMWGRIVPIKNKNTVGNSILNNMKEKGYLGDPDSLEMSDAKDGKTVSAVIVGFYLGKKKVKTAKFKDYNFKGKYRIKIPII